MELYQFVIKRRNGERRVRTFPSLQEALRSRHAYKKSPHFRSDDIGLVYKFHNDSFVPSLSEVAIFKNKRVKPCQPEA